MKNKKREKKIESSVSEASIENIMTVYIYTDIDDNTKIIIVYKICSEKTLYFSLKILLFFSISLNIFSLRLIKMMTLVGLLNVHRSLFV